ncbi:hypothetical protein CYMTET_34847 [Cymbomonas tetramitiformis]|uniref:Uncharacterized protein n=1 Tax=Cymbomonas tetramitiformis TaxID=36881 RepID=A0AAE0FA79_9CHLO|nr:hypothetical protein CYMTET_34847 [Cymbomonas tetramitiformis]
MPGPADDVIFDPGYGTPGKVDIVCSTYDLPYGVCQAQTFGKSQKAAVSRRALLEASITEGATRTSQDDQEYFIDTLDGPHSMLEVASMTIGKGWTVSITTNVFLNLADGESESLIEGTLELHSEGLTGVATSFTFGGLFGPSPLVVRGALNLCGGILAPSLPGIPLEGNLTVLPEGTLNVGCSNLPPKPQAIFLQRPTTIEANARMCASFGNLEDTISHAGNFWGLDSASQPAPYMDIVNRGTIEVNGFLKLHQVNLYNGPGAVIKIPQSGSLISGGDLISNLSVLTNDHGTLDIGTSAYGSRDSPLALDNVQLVSKDYTTHLVANADDLGYTNYGNVTLHCSALFSTKASVTASYGVTSGLQSAAMKAA